MKKLSLFGLAAALAISLAYNGRGEIRNERSDTLLKVSNDLLLSGSENRGRARAIAEERGWPVRGLSRDRRRFELQGIERGLPFYYMSFNNADAAATTRTDSARHYIGGGAGFTIGLWDGDAPRVTHQELAGRVVWADPKTLIADDHATHVSGTLVGAGVRPQARGMAPEASIRAFQWDDDLAEMAAEAAKGLLISNHSYGLVRGWTDLGSWYWFGDTAVSEVEDYLFGFYSASSRALDEILHAAPNYLVVHSAGNDRNDSVAAGTSHYYYDVRYGTWRRSTKVRNNDGAPLGYDCLPNGASLAKNVLLVGAVKPVLDYTGPASVEMTPYSSWGPTDDGRIKPDICGDGWAVYSSIAASDTSYAHYYGTSMASPNVCGSLGLLQDYYRDTHHGLPMRAATLKALAIHAAREAGPSPGPDYGFGWGLLDTYAAFRRIEADLDDRLGFIEELTLIEDFPVEFFYFCDGTAPELKATIVWTDPAGTPPAPALDPSDRMLVNDLDLRIEREGTVYEPWTLDPLDPAAPAAKGDNAVDNVEQVLIEHPAAGIYTIRIANDGSLQGGTQEFSLVVSGASRTNTWHVFADGGGDAPTIAAAVDSAASGDQILVYPGVYAEHDIVADKAVAIKGLRGAAYTIVDAAGLGRCFTLPAGAGPLRIEGLTLKNGAAEGMGDDGSGGAILARNEEAAIAGCVVANCRAVRGGGLFVEFGLSELRQCTFRSNIASESGGGIYINEADMTIDRCVVVWNRSLGDGGGAYVKDASPAVTRSTFAYGAALGHGGGIYLTEGAGASISQCIVAFTGAGEGLFQNAGGGGVMLSCSDLYGNIAGDVGGAVADPAGDETMLSADPQFCDAGRFDFGIGDGSPCRPEGNPCGVPIGALGERCHTKTTWYVEADGSGDEPTIAAAVSRAAPGDTILLAAGIYTGTGNRNISFGGKNLVVRSESGPASTIVDCGAASGQVHYGFSYDGGEDSTATLEGITIRHAAVLGVRCRGAGPVIRECIVDSCRTNGYTRGGGMYLEKSTAAVIGCTITRNAADPTGGGIYTREFTGRIEDCTVSGNTAARYGGGIGLHTGTNARVARCVIENNAALGDHGGGVYIVSARAQIDTCSVTGNSGSFGGGIYNGLNAYCTARGTVIAANAAVQGGGGVYTNSNMSMTNCTVAGNSCPQYGAGIESFSAALNPISRSIIAFNIGSQGILTVSGVQSISCSDVFGNAGGDYGGSTPDQTGLNGNFSVDPGFCDASSLNFALFDTSACAAGRSPCAALVGARDVACRIAPNLVIESVSPDTVAAAAGGSVVFEIVVRNDGVADADTFAIDYFADRAAAPHPGEVGDRRIVVPALAVGETVLWTTAPVQGDTIGQWRSWIVVDGEGRVTETDENDNASGPHPVRWAAPREAGWPTAAAGIRTSPLLVDLDGDASTLEIVAGGDDGRLHAWSADGVPLSGWPVTLGGAVLSIPAGGDIAGDTRSEIVVGCDDGKVYAFDHLGQKLWDAVVSGPATTTPALADLDGDGKCEVLCGAGGYLHALEGTGAVFPGAWPFDLGAPDVTSPAAGDIDGDGAPEIAVAGWTGGESGRSLVCVLRNDGSLYGGGWPAVVDTVCADPVMGDIGGDHSRLEIACAAADGTIYVWNADGSPCCAPQRIVGFIESSPALADLDDDGYLDVAVTSRRWMQEGETGCWESYASAVGAVAGVLFSERISMQPDDFGAFPGPIAIGDRADLIAGTPEGTLLAFLAGFAIEAGGPITAVPAAGDLDGDGWVEIAAVSGGDSVRCFELRTGRFPANALRWPLARRDASRAACHGYEPVSGIEGDPDASPPAASGLRSLYPNPFNPSVSVLFDVAHRSHVGIRIYDVAGREVALLVSRELERGRYEISWNGRNSIGAAVASGVYFCRFTCGDYAETRKIILMR